MAKELKLYVPVSVVKIGESKDRRMKQKPVLKTTFLGVHNCSLLKTMIPANKDITEHLIAQREIMNRGGAFASIKVSVTPAKFQELSREIGSKMGGRYGAPIIDVVVEAGQKPIIQIIGNKTEAVAKPKFERTAPHRFERGS